MSADLVIHNGRIVHPDGIVEASLAIRDGRIMAIGTADSMPAAAETMDAASLHWRCLDESFAPLRYAVLAAISVMV